MVLPRPIYRLLAFVLIRSSTNIVSENSAFGQNTALLLFRLLVDHPSDAFDLMRQEFDFQSLDHTIFLVILALGLCFLGFLLWGVYRLQSFDQGLWSGRCFSLGGLLDSARKPAALS